MKSLPHTESLWRSTIPAFAQPLLPPPPYQLPITVVTQKWFGFGPPAAVPGNQPGDSYFDNTNHLKLIPAQPRGPQWLQPANQLRPVSGFWAVAEAVQAQPIQQRHVLAR